MDCTNKANGGKLHVVYGDITLGLHGKRENTNFAYIFSYAAGGLESININGREWLYRVPKPTYWRAATDNDKGNKFAYRSAMWLGADAYTLCQGAEIYVNGSHISFPGPSNNNSYTNYETVESVKIVYTYETATVPVTKTEVSYEVAENGEIKVDVHYYGKKELPELPVFGMRFIMPTKAVSYRYQGLSGETYPDRMAGGIQGVYQLEGLPVTNYLVPQDCNVHMETKWLEVQRDSTRNNADHGEETFGLRFEAAGKNFTFSCIPYTALELESATHQEELPPERRTVVCILGAVRGVGGIDSWCADVEPAYHINAEEDIRFSFVIVPL